MILTGKVGSIDLLKEKAGFLNFEREGGIPSFSKGKVGFLDFWKGMCDSLHLKWKTGFLNFKGKAEIEER